MDIKKRLLSLLKHTSILLNLTYLQLCFFPKLLILTCLILDRGTNTNSNLLNFAEGKRADSNLLNFTEGKRAESNLLNFCRREKS